MSAKKNTEDSPASFHRTATLCESTAKLLVNSTSRSILEYFDTQYMTYLYESLMRSVGKVGNVENFARNVSQLRHIIELHYASKPCISDICSSLKPEREKLFRSIFTSSFNQDGLKDFNINAKGNLPVSPLFAEVETDKIVGNQTALNPLAGKHFCPVYMAQLYECLLKSVGHCGNLQNFRRNLHLLRFIIDQHYEDEDCISDFCDSLRAEREEFFRPFFDNVFVQDGLKNLRNFKRKAF